jgi:hypothetical protein
MINLLLTIFVFLDEYWETLFVYRRGVLHMIESSLYVVKVWHTEEMLMREQAKP